MAAQVLLLEALGGLTGGVNKLADGIEDGISLFDEAQKVSLALGTNLEQARTTLAPSIDNLRGSIDNTLSIGLASLNSGLEGNVKGIATLANQQQLTGQDFKKTFKVFSELVSIGGVQLDASNELADQIRENSATYGVSTEALVGSLKAVEQTLAAQNLLGFGTEIQGAIVELQATLGPELQGSLGTVMNLMLKPGTDSLAQLTMLGIGNVRERIEAARGDQAAVSRILKESVITAGENFEKLAGGANAGFTSLGIMEQAVGKNSAMFSVLSQQLQEGARARREGDMNYANTISTLTSEVWNPLKQALLPLISKSLPFLALGAQWVSKGIGYLAENLDVIGAIVGASLLPLLGVVVASFKGMQMVLDPLANSIRTALFWFKETELSLMSIPGTVEELEVQLMLGASKFFSGILSSLSDVSFELFGKEITPFGGLDTLSKGLNAATSVLEGELKVLQAQNEEIRKHSADTANNTRPAPNKYIQETNGIIDGAISRVLGIKENRSISLQEQMVDALVEVNARLADNKPSPIPQINGNL